MRHEAALPTNEVSLRQADLALGAALVWYVQEYLATVSDGWDVDLFFESYGRVPTSGWGWSDSIIDGLVFRPDISESDRVRLVDQSVAKAVQVLRANAS